MQSFTPAINCIEPVKDAVSGVLLLPRQKESISNLSHVHYTLECVFRCKVDNIIHICKWSIMLVFLEEANNLMVRATVSNPEDMHICQFDAVTQCTFPT